MALTDSTRTVTISEAVALGKAQLDLDEDAFSELAARAHAIYAATNGFHSATAQHFYGKRGYDAAGAAELFRFICQFLALNLAWHELGYRDVLSLPEKADSDGWHGLIIQTRDYEALCLRMGSFVHHATTEAPQADAVLRTLALINEIFGPIGEPVWADCPGCIIYGWCGGGTD